MAEFNPETGIQTPQDMLGYAGNARPGNKAFESLFSGAGDAVTQAAGVVDTQNLFDIKNQVQANLDQTNKLFGYDQDSVPDTVGSRTNTPPELNGAGAQLSKLSAAKAQGKLTDSHYWALLQSNVKDLKSKYPGYSDQIDNIVSSVTGGTPANQLRASIAAYNAKLAGAEEDTQKQIDNALNSPEIARVAPDYYPGNPKYDTAGKAQLYQKLRQIQSRDAVYDSASKAAAFDKSQDEASQQGYKQTYGQQANAEVQTGLNSVVQAAGIGGPGSNFFTSIGKLQNNPSPQAVQQIQGALNTAKANIQQRLLAMRTSGVGVKLSPQDQEAAEKAAMQPLETIQSLITDGNFGLAARYANDNKFIDDKNLNTIYNNSLDAQRMAAITKISPAIATNYAITHGDAFVDSLQSQWFNPIQAGLNTPDDLNTQLKNSAQVTPSMRSKAVTAGVKGLVGSLANPETPDSLIKTQVSSLFRPDGSGGLQQVWADTTSDSKGALFTTLTTPSVVDRIAKADPNAAKTFAQWTFNKAQELPEVRGIAGTIGQAGPANVQFVYNPNTHQFLIGKPTANGIEPMQAKDMMDAQQLQITKFNRVLANVAYAQQKAGLDPNDPSNPGSIPALLKILGAQGQSGNVQELQKAFEQHSDNATGDTPKTEANLSDSGPSFQFLTDPDTANNLRTGQLANGDIKSIIRSAESGKSNYDASIRDNGNPRAEFSKMTVSQVLQAQSSLPNSKAIGAYQFIPSTLHYAIDKAGIKLSDKFDEATQDRLADVLMEGAGYSRWKAGKITDDEFHNNLAQIWAGLPETNGMSHYEGINGNHATVSVNDVRNALRRSRG